VCIFSIIELGGINSGLTSETWLLALILRGHLFSPALSLAVPRVAKAEALIPASLSEHFFLTE